MYRIEIVSLLLLVTSCYLLCLNLEYYIKQYKYYVNNNNKCYLITH